MTGIFELCSMSGFNNNGMAASWSEEPTAVPITAGSGGCRTYCVKCGGVEPSAAAEETGWSASAVVDCTGAIESAWVSGVISHTENKQSVSVVIMSAIARHSQEQANWANVSLTFQFVNSRLTKSFMSSLISLVHTQSTVLINWATEHFRDVFIIKQYTNWHFTFPSPQELRRVTWWTCTSNIQD